MARIFGTTAVGLNSTQVIQLVRKHQSKVLLSFSRGKDSLAAWLVLREHFDEVIPFYLDKIPGLEFVEQSLRDYEEYFGCHIYRLAHPTTNDMIVSLTDQPPERRRIIQQMTPHLIDFSYNDVREALLEFLGEQEDMLYATGVRSADSMTRRGALAKYGAITWNQFKFHPVFDYSKQQIIDLFTKHKAFLPVDYDLMGRTFDSTQLSAILPIKKHFPRDYERIREMYPMVEAEIFRYECAMRGKNKHIKTKA
jgi:3'-phosphoadenosine 5'-phosphosulfate sulfotransferase (PAPS reductase)/FAD synthetase